MSQKAVELVIGRLATDEGARARFRRAPRDTVASLASGAQTLTTLEAEALAAIDTGALERFADAIDPRLQRVAVPETSGGGLP